MHPRRHRVRAALAVLALPVLWSFAGGVAGADATLVDVGWWTRSPLASAPDGGFTVGSAPDGPTSVAAVRVDLGEGVDTLVLDAMADGDPSALTSLQVCMAADTWSPEPGAALDAAPATECAGDAVPFARAGTSWRADVTSLVHGTGGTVSLAIVPTSGSGTIPFEASFAAPAARSTGGGAPEPAPAPAPSATPSSPSPAPATSPSPAPGPSPSIAPAPLAPPTSAPAPPPAEEGDDDSAAAAPPTTAEPEAGSAFELAGSGLLNADDAGEGARWGEALVLVLIGALVGTAVYGTSRLAAARA